MHPRLFLVVLIFTMFNLVGQAVASPLNCFGMETTSEADNEKPHCDEMQAETEPSKDASGGCCAGGCDAMMQCSAISAIVIKGTLQADHQHRISLHISGPSVIEPDGLITVPEMRPPITT